MSKNKSIQLGLCCMNTELQSEKPQIMSSRSCTLKTLETKGFEPLKEKIIQNLKDTLVLMDWNEKNGIKVFRLSSDLFPHFSNQKAMKYDISFAMDLLKEIGDKSKKYNQRLTFHPGQYNVIGTPNKEIFLNTTKDLKYHCDILDFMGLDKNSVVVIHGGGVYGDKQKTLDRWCQQFYTLPENVQNRLVLENCEKNFSIEDCLEISNRINIPVVFDTHHFECYKLLHKEEKFSEADEYIHAILETWWKRKIKPKFHVSEQGSGKIGHHSDFIETIPEYLLEIPHKFACSIDIMIEAKLKEQAIFKLYEKYPYFNCKVNKIRKPKLNIKAMECEIKCNEECLCYT